MFQAASQPQRDAAGTRLRLLSYNIQSGQGTQHRRDYVTKSWQTFLPHPVKQQNLNRIASLLGGYDLVGLQEVDAGSLRSAFIDQTEYLAHRAGFSNWNIQVNRDIGHFGQFGNGFLCRYEPASIHCHRLPGLRGRGVMVIKFGEGDTSLSVLLVHLALGRRGRLRQMHFMRELLTDSSYNIVMGDLNCASGSHLLEQFLSHAGLVETVVGEPTFPSWEPVRKIDHILVSESLTTENPAVEDFPLSDHLPVRVDVLLPFKLPTA
ncbi:MAG: endonuclease/exonuclease/phosphatase family protein [Pseudomonadota bacterium]